MTKANELKRADVISANGVLYVIRQIDVQTPSARGAATLYRVKATALSGSGKYEERFKGDDDVDTVQVTRRHVQFSYLEGDDVIFMDSEDFTQYPIRADEVEEEMAFITEGIEGLQVLLVEDKVIGLELPASVVLEIVETAPAMKSASASARTKPATLTTGLVVQVPEYIETGERIRVNTAERKYSARA
jgi:elongation factor P